uniref:Uncharacterized protein n=1 Tax=Arundo donax TaxID=35708 RepID=A0A0A9AJD3_ARUDO
MRALKSVVLTVTCHVCY